MSPKVHELSEEAKALTPSDKLALVDELLAQLDIPDPEIEQAWADEVGRRIEADRAGKLETFSYDEVMSRFRKP